MLLFSAIQAPDFEFSSSSISFKTIARVQFGQVSNATHWIKDSWGLGLIELAKTHSRLTLSSTQAFIHYPYLAFSPSPYLVRLRHPGFHTRSHVGA